MKKVGWKKRWLTAIPVILGSVVASGILDDTVTLWDNKLIGLAIAIFGALGYGVARAVDKTKVPK